MDRRKTSTKKAIETTLIDVCHRLYEKGLVVATDGNVSARLSNGNILTTRSGINKGMITRKDLVEVIPDGVALRAKEKPSTELGIANVVESARPFEERGHEHLRMSDEWRCWRENLVLTKLLTEC